MTKLINGKTNENELNIIATQAISDPEIVVPNDFTALHIASICWELYSDSAPTHFRNEFTICEDGDFAMYNVHEYNEIAQHYFDTAFAIGESVKSNPNLPVQEAYDAAIDFLGDTCVRESVMSDVLYEIDRMFKSDEYKSISEFVQEDYAMLNKHEEEAKENEIARLEQQLADLKES